MPMTWSTDACYKLFLFILASNPNVKIDFESAAKLFTNDDVTCTPRAVQEQLKKMKKQVAGDKDFELALAFRSSKPTTAMTPRTPTPKKRIVKRMKRAPTASDLEKDSENSVAADDEQSPAKKMKVDKLPRTTVANHGFKQEPDEYEGVLETV